MSNQQTFEQKRIVQLSKKLDQERQRCLALINETHQLNQKYKYTRDEYEKQKQLRQQFEFTVKQLKSKVTGMQKQVSELRESKSLLEKKVLESQFANVQGHRQIERLKEELKNYESKIKEHFFELQKQFQLKEKQNVKLREQNLQLQKMYLNKREEMQRNQQKFWKQLTKLVNEIKQVKGDAIMLKQSFEKSIQKQRNKLKQIYEQANEKIHELDLKIEEAARLRRQINQLQAKLQEVIIQNSQRIIQIYNLKYGQKISANNWGNGFSLYSNLK